MKKILLAIIVFLSGINIVLAESSAYLTSLNIKGYDLSPNFNKYNNTYSVDIDEETTSLDLDYKLEDENATIEIIGNDLLTEEQNNVQIKVTNGEEIQNYIIYVNKNKSNEVMNLDSNAVEVEVNKKYNMKIVLGMLIVAWLLSAYLLKRIIYFKRK